MQLSQKNSLLLSLAAAAIVTGYTLMTGCAGASILKGDAQAKVSTGKALVVYFTYAENIGDTSSMGVDALTAASLHMPTENTINNTLLMVNEIKSKTSADTYSIVITDPYNPKFEAMTDRARAEIEQKQQLAFKDPLPDLSAYDTVYFGSPIWWYTTPAAVRNFLERVSLKGKTVVPFGIHRGSGLHALLEVLKETQSEARITDAFTVDASVANAEVKAQFNAFLDTILK